MATTSTSQALTKRLSDSALMPPPPPPKRIKRPQKVLDEDDYTDALSHIIARDFFPGLMQTESQQDYLNALDSQDHEWIASATRKLTEVMTPGPDGRKHRGRRGTSMTSGIYGRGEETPTAWQGDTPVSVTSTTSTQTTVEKPAIDTKMSLGAFQSKYTSEDNESFYKLLDKQNLKKSEKYAWMWAGNKIPASRQIAHRKREAILSTQTSTSNDKQLVTISHPDTRPAMPDAWPTRPDNTFMFPPSSIEDTHQTVQQAAEDQSRAPPKSVIYDNTRIAPHAPTSDIVPPSPSLSAIQDAISGHPRPTASEANLNGSSTPRINGYAFVDPGSPSEKYAPLLINPDTPNHLLGAGDATPNPFNIKASSKREDLLHRMVEKVAKGKRIGKREAELKTPVPKFASSPRVGSGGLTPAAHRLLGKVGRTPGIGVVWEGKTPKGSGLRSGWTPKG